MDFAWVIGEVSLMKWLFFSVLWGMLGMASAVLEGLALAGVEC